MRTGREIENDKGEKGVKVKGEEKEVKRQDEGHNMCLQVNLAR